MKQALVNGQLAPATPDAPVTAICPRCEGEVELRDRLGTYFWRHVALPRGGCRPQPGGTVGDADGGVAGGGLEGRTRQVGDFVIELHPGGEDVQGHYLKLCRLSTEGNEDPLRPGPSTSSGGTSGQASGMVVYVSEVRPLVKVLLEAVTDLVDLVVGSGGYE